MSNFYKGHNDHLIIFITIFDQNSSFQNRISNLEYPRNLNSTAAKIPFLLLSKEPCLERWPNSSYLLLVFVVVCESSFGTKINFK